MENITATLNEEEIRLLLNPPKEKTLADFTLAQIAWELIKRSGAPINERDIERVDVATRKKVFTTRGSIKEKGLSFEFSVAVCGTEESIF